MFIYSLLIASFIGLILSNINPRFQRAAEALAYYNKWIVKDQKLKNLLIFPPKIVPLFEFISYIINLFIFGFIIMVYVIYWLTLSSFLYNILSNGLTLTIFIIIEIIILALFGGIQNGMIYTNYIGKKEEERKRKALEEE